MDFSSILAAHKQRAETLITNSENHSIVRQSTKENIAVKSTQTPQWFQTPADSDKNKSFLSTRILGSPNIVPHQRGISPVFVFPGLQKEQSISHNATKVHPYIPSEVYRSTLNTSFAKPPPQHAGYSPTQSSDAGESKALISSASSQATLVENHGAHEELRVSNNQVSGTDCVKSRKRQLSVPKVFSEPKRRKRMDEINLEELSNYVTVDDLDDADDSSPSVEKELKEAATAPVFSYGVGALLQSKAKSRQVQKVFPQYGLIGSFQERSDYGSDNEDSDSEENLWDNLLFANMNAPWSAFICGSQGAGKSHTLSCLLENALQSKTIVSKLPNPLAGTIFHYDKFTGDESTQFCEAAYLCSSGIPVTVLVTPSNIWTMTKLYSELPGLPEGSPKPKVLPLYFSEQQLNIGRVLSLMAVAEGTAEKPLYLEVVTNVLREMAMEGRGGRGFNYADFKQRLENTTWVQGQSVPLNMRLQLLESFLEPSALSQYTRPAQAKEDIWAFKNGTLTIVDLSDPFVSETDACSLFAMCLSIFMENRGNSGRIVALDEAHKFLLQSGAAKKLTEQLTSIIRQQRHLGTRVVIATQEPTISPTLIDLCNLTIVHRFLSPAWYAVLKNHIAAASKDFHEGHNGIFDQIVELKTGEALLFCPTALLEVRENKAKALGNGYTRIRVRKRITADGGKSIMASDKMKQALQLEQVKIEMHVVTKPPPSTNFGHLAQRGGFGGRGGFRGRGSGSPQTIRSTATPIPTALTSHSTTVPARIVLKLAEVIRDGFQYKGWVSVGSINYDKILDQVETASQLPKNHIRVTGMTLDCKRLVASQINLCRQERGWSQEVNLW